MLSKICLTFGIMKHPLYETKLKIQTTKNMCWAKAIYNETEGFTRLR
jgi:hypothetical protein